MNVTDFHVMILSLYDLGGDKVRYVAQKIEK